MSTDRFTAIFTVAFQDPDREGRVIKPATLQQEKEWYAKSLSEKPSVAELKNLPVTHVIHKHGTDPGKPVSEEAVNEAINHLQSVQYGVPGFALGNVSVSDAVNPPKVT